MVNKEGVKTSNTQALGVGPVSDPPESTRSLLFLSLLIIFSKGSFNACMFGDDMISKKCEDRQKHSRVLVLRYSIN